MTNARMTGNDSLIFVLRCILHGLILLIHPMPGIGAADDQSDDQQHQRPGVCTRMVVVQPKAEQCAEQRRYRYGPTNESRHAQTKPDSLIAFALYLELAGSLRAHSTDECFLFTRG